MRNTVVGVLLVALLAWSAYCFWGPYQIQSALIASQTGPELAQRAPAIVAASGLTPEQFSEMWAVPTLRQSFTVGVIPAMWHARIEIWAAASALLAFLTILAAIMLPKPDEE